MTINRLAAHHRDDGDTFIDELMPASALALSDKTLSIFDLSHTFYLKPDENLYRATLTEMENV